LAATTKVNYRDNLENHILPEPGDRKVIDLRPRLTAVLLAHLFDAKQLSPATVRMVRTVLSAVMSFAAAMECVESNPVMKVPPPQLTAAGRGLCLASTDQGRCWVELEQTLWVAPQDVIRLCFR
jgi:hypothetical protein